MRDFTKTTFLTLVLMLCLIFGPTSQSWAAPQVTTQLPPIQVDMTPIPGPVWVRERSPNNYSLYGGATGGNFIEADQTISSELYGFRFSRDQDEYHAVDYNVELGHDGIIGFNLGQRIFFDLPTSFLPYIKWGGGMHFRPIDNLLNLVEIKRIQARGAVGTADLFQWNRFVYLEAGVGLAVVGIEYYGVLGLNFNL